METMAGNRAVEKHGPLEGSEAPHRYDWLAPTQVASGMEAWSPCGMFPNFENYLKRY